MWESATGTLFSGDIVYDGPLIEDTYHANSEDYYRSMTRLLEIPSSQTESLLYLVLPKRLPRSSP